MSMVWASDVAVVGVSGVSGGLGLGSVGSLVAELAVGSVGSASSAQPVSATPRPIVRVAARAARRRERRCVVRVMWATPRMTAVPLSESHAEQDRGCPGV